MKKVFIDTNVILDYILQREHCAEAKAVIRHFITTQTEMLMSVGGFYTMLYIIEKYLRKELHLDTANRTATLRTLLTQILQTFKVAEHDNNSLIQGINTPLYTDLEDSCQYQLAKKTGCELLVTFNDKHFPQTEVAIPKVISPQQFIEDFIQS